MTASALDLTAFDAALKIIYSDRRLKNMAYTKNPFLAMIPKNSKFRGKSNYVCPVWYTGGQGGSRTFSSAQSNSRTGGYKDFHLTRCKDYSIGYLDIETMLASRGNEAAFLEASKAEMDGRLQSIINNLALSVFKNHGGARGQVSGISSTALTLTNPSDVVNFEKGMVLVQSTADGTSGALGSGSSEITAVDRRAGILYAANWTNFTANDYLFRTGDFGASVYGILDWIPATTPTAGDSFFSVDRSTDTRLYGQYVDGSNKDIVEALLDLDTSLYREGAQCDVAIVSPTDFNAIRKRLGGEIEYEMSSKGASDDAKVTFQSIVIPGMSGRIDIVADRSMPVNYGLVTQMDSWELAQLDGLPKLQTNPVTGEALRLSENADQVEYRMSWYGQLGNHAPGYSGLVKFR